MKAKILSNYYREAGLFVTEEESRYSLNALRIEPHPEKGAVIVATDGHTLGVFHDAGGQCDAAGVTLLFNKALSDMCAEERTLEVNDDGSAALLHRGKELVRFAGVLTDGAFPNWRTPLPKWDSYVERNDYNPEYLERCARASGAQYPHLAIWSGSDGLQVTHGKGRAAVVVPYERDDCFFLVMPMRQGSAEYPKLIEALRLKDATDIERPALAQAAT